MNKTFEEKDCINLNDNRFVIKNVLNHLNYLVLLNAVKSIYMILKIQFVFALELTESIDDMIANLKLNQEKLILPNFNQGYYPYVHKGFLEQFNSVRDLISKEINLIEKYYFLRSFFRGALLQLLVCIIHIYLII